MIEQFWLANKIRFALATETDLFVAEFSGENRSLGECRLSYTPIYDEETMEDKSIEREYEGFRAKVTCELVYVDTSQKGNFRELLVILSQCKPIIINLNFDDVSDLFPLEDMWLDSNIDLQKLFRLEEFGQTLKLEFIAKRKVSAIPILTINWDGYNEGPFDDGLYNE